jgi:hypothetical protein
MKFWQKLRKTNKPVIVVSGLPRSGTSMMMKMLQAGGIEPVVDNIRAADDDNPQGYFELERVKRLDKGDTAWVAEAQGKAVKVISQLLKYLPDEYEYKVIFMRRAMPEILASQKKMLVNRGEDPNKVDDEEIAVLFEKHLRNVMTWLDTQPTVSTLYIHSSETLADPQTQAKIVNEFLGGGLDVEGMTAVVDPTLYRNRQS